MPPRATPVAPHTHVHTFWELSHSPNAYTGRRARTRGQARAPLGAIHGHASRFAVPCINTCDTSIVGVLLAFWGRGIIPRFPPTSACQWARCAEPLQSQDNLPNGVK